MRFRPFALAAVLLAIAVTAILFSCSQNPTNVPIRTFERAQRVDVICLRVFGPDAPEPLPQEACSPVSPGVRGDQLSNQLFALVTQTTRGEVAVVGLSAGALVDQSRAVPGVNFLPVGSIPTDVATTPDGRMAFVASAEPNKFAIYGIPGHRILGDAAVRKDPEGATTLASWPACALPQRPGALTVVPRRTTAVLADAGAADAGAAPSDGPPYELVAVLPGDRTTRAKVVTIDPRPFLRGSPRRSANGAIVDLDGPGPALTPGTLEACPITAAIELAGPEAVPDAIRAGIRWDDGVKYVDGGVDLTCDRPEQPQTCGQRPCSCRSPITGDAGPVTAPDGGAIDNGACAADAGAPSVPERALELGPLDPPQPVAIARDDQMIYIADDALPLVHAIDVSGAPRELEPFVVSSLTDPSRLVSIRDIAVSPPTREYKRFLYAVDRKQGSIAVFDVTDPTRAERSPMRRPHPELNPFQPPDRIGFSAPVVAIAFARHDFPLRRINGRPQPNARSGLICNPNPRIDPSSGSPADFGVYYRANFDDDSDIPHLGPGRLRGIFAFATLSNGQVVTIDVDDWDAPCRRPIELRGSASTTDGVAVSTGVLAIAQPEPGDGDFDPYHAPIAPPESVTGEAFFPVAAPHRLRSTFFLRDDSTTGTHVPFLTSTPSIQSPTAPLPLFGEGSEATPRLRPTASRPGITAGTQDIGVRFSLDAPDVHFDQDWAITYEGGLPGFQGLSAIVSTTDGYSSLVLSQPQGRFCDKGIEDWNVGSARAASVTNALIASGRPVPTDRFERRMIDYVQLNEELLPPGDPYWRQDDLPGADACWGPRLNPADGSPAAREEAARARHETCTSAFGTLAEATSNRDFPILEAYDDRLVIGRFANVPPSTTREAIYSHPSNATSLKLMRCCFHNQVRFNVRAGSQWVALGSRVGVLHHLVRGEGGRCVSSCNPDEALLNGRAPSLPFGPGDFAPFRDSPLALRNPQFSLFVQNGNRDGADAIPIRDTSWRFQSRGSFAPLVINLAAATTAVNPQSMRFIETLGQIAVVDGSSQGLVLLDLARVSIARAPYF
jgi:hypothetical protein